VRPASEPSRQTHGGRKEAPPAGTRPPAHEVVGPDTETAAITDAAGTRTGAETSPHLLGAFCGTLSPAPLAHLGQRTVGELPDGRDACWCPSR